MMRSRLAACGVLLALISSANAAHDFDSNVVDSYAESTTTPEVTAAPLSMCCWFNSDNVTTNQVLIGVHHSTLVQRFFVVVGGNTAGDPIGASTGAGGTSGQANTSTSYTADTWHHACGVFASSTSRTAYLDAGGKVTNTTSVTPSGIDRTGVGMTRTSGAVSVALLDGSVAECGIWSAALSDGEVAELAKGFAPPCVRPDALEAYYPSIRQTGALFDRAFGTQINNLAIVGTNNVLAHPPTIKYCQ